MIINSEEEFNVSLAELSVITQEMSLMIRNQPKFKDIDERLEHANKVMGLLDKAIDHTNAQVEYKTQQAASKAEVGNNANN